MEPATNAAAPPPLVYLPITEVMRRTSYARSTVWAEVKAGRLPKPAKLGVGNKVGWVEHELDAVLRKWLEARDAEA